MNFKRLEQKTGIREVDLRRALKENGLESFEEIKNRSLKILDAEIEMYFSDEPYNIFSEKPIANHY